jgi:serine---pyruvate transaminase
MSRHALRALAGQWHHRDPEFLAIVARLRDQLKSFCRTSRDVVLFGAGGTGGLEAVAASLLAPGDRVVAVNAGRFGARWSAMALAFGAKVHEVVSAPGESPDARAILAALDSAPSCRALLMQGVETSTGALLPVQKVAQAMRGRETLLCVDGISWLGAHEARPDDWGIDLMVGASQKAPAAAPGLSFVMVGERAEQALRARRPAAAYYFDLLAELEAQREGAFRFTPPVQLVAALEASLAEQISRGLDAELARVRALAHATRAAAAALGLNLFARVPADSLTAMELPEGLNAADLTARLKSQTGILVATGQDGQKNRVLRVAHFGGTDFEGTVKVLAALERELSALGRPVQLGAAETAARKVWKQHEEKPQDDRAHEHLH